MLEGENMRFQTFFFSVLIFIFARPIVAGERVEWSIPFQGLDGETISRRVIAYVPEGMRHDSPLLVCLHGSSEGDSPALSDCKFGMEMRLLEIDGPRAPVILYPEAPYREVELKRDWNSVKATRRTVLSDDIGTPGSEATFEDLLFLRELILESLPRLMPGYRPEHRWVIGFSSGASLMWTVLCYQSSLFTAYGGVGHVRHSGNYFVEGSWQTVNPLNPNCSASEGEIDLGKGVTNELLMPGSKTVAYLHGTEDFANQLPGEQYPLARDFLLQVQDRVRSVYGSPKGLRDLGFDETTTYLYSSVLAGRKTVHFGDIHGANHSFPRLLMDPSLPANPQDYSGSQLLQSLFLRDL